MATFADLFTAREKLTLVNLATQVTSRECSDAARACLAMTQSKQADYLSSLCTWHYHNREKVNHTFARQALPFITDFVETVASGSGSGGWDGLSDWTAMAVEEACALPPKGSVQIADACASPLPDNAGGIWFTDPPYYDAVPYADLSDFFFVWLKRTLAKHPLLRDPFDPTNRLTPKRREAVQDETKRDDGRPKDQRWFEETMANAFAEGRRVLRDDGVGCVVFAHKTTEGWEALLSGMIRGGWVITGSWPIATEMGSRLRARDSAALATSIHLVCRPRTEDSTGDWTDVSRELPKRVRHWMERLEQEGVRGADLVFACIGPALEIYSRYAKVVDAQDREIPLGGDPEAKEPHKRGYLAYVWEVVGRIALEQVLGTAEARAQNGGALSAVPGTAQAGGALEEDARLTALFLWTLQATKQESTAEEEEGAAEEAEEEEEEEGEGSKNKKKPGYPLVFDVVRRFAQPLGIHLPEWENRIIQTDRGVVYLLFVHKRAEQLFGEEGAQAVASRLERETQGDAQMVLFREGLDAEAPRVRGRRDGRGAAGSGEEAPRAQQAATTLDRVHAAILLQASGKSTALRTMLQTEKERGPDFLRLANALSALYPKDSSEKRLLDAMLLAMPR